jgi:hypothetical protein
VLGHTFGHAQANAAISAGDKANLAGQVKQVFHAGYSME